MTKELTERDLMMLEALVDLFDIQEVLNGLASICDGKAEHLRTNWQDEASATEWEARAKRIREAV